MSTLTDNRQLICRDQLPEVLATNNTQTDAVLRAVDTLLQPSFRIYAAATPSYVVYVGAGSITNPKSLKKKAPPPVIGGSTANAAFTTATITFTATSATPSNGSAISFTIADDQYLKVLVTVNNGSLVLSSGTAGATADLATLPDHEDGATGGSERVSGYVLLHKTGSALDVIPNESLYQFDFPKYIPSGEIVGTSDAQTLTDKTLTSPVIDGVASDLIPTTDDDFDLGSSALRWQNAYISDNIILGGSLEAPGGAETVLDIGTTTDTAKINIGTASTIDEINIGSSTGAGTINVGTGSGNDLINIGTGAGTDTINIGTGPGIQLINIGTGTNTSTINIGGPSDTVTIAGTLNVQVTNNTAVADKTIELNVGGAVASAPGSGIQVDEADGSPITISAAEYQSSTFRMRFSTSDTENATVGSIVTIIGYGNALDGTYVAADVDVNNYIEVVNPSVTSSALDSTDPATATVPKSAGTIIIGTAGDTWEMAAGADAESFGIKTEVRGRGMES
jgi:hypothetical protein